MITILFFKNKINQSISYQKQLKHFASSINGPKITIIEQFKQHFASSTKGPKLSVKQLKTALRELH